MEKIFIPVTINGKKTLINMRYIIGIFETRDGGCSIRVDEKDGDKNGYQFPIDEIFKEIEGMLDRG